MIKLWRLHQSFSFASPVEVLRALQVYCTSYYGSMLWDFRGVGATQFFNAWTTAIKLTWDCPRATRTYLVQKVLACESMSAKSEILSRFCKFFQGLCSSPSREVAILANLVARDIRSPTGSNIQLIAGLTESDPWTVGPTTIRSKLTDSEEAPVEDMDMWRLKYLSLLFEQKQEWLYRGVEEEKRKVQQIVDSLCVN